MTHVLKNGILIGVLCGAWILIMGVTGWYMHPVLAFAFWVVIPIQVGVLVYGLAATGNQDDSFWPQVWRGTLMSLIAAVILFFVSYLFTTLLFPTYFEDIRNTYAGMMRDAGQTEQQIDAALQEQQKQQTPFLQAASGFLGTVATGFVASLIIMTVRRRKRSRVA